jgi:tetratricopeptide (TPR) repeat protein
MRKSGKPSSSGAIIILRQMEKHEWLFTLPRITEEVDDRLEEGIDWIDAYPERAATIFMGLIDEYPEHMDAYHHSALTLEKMGKSKEAFQTWKLAVDTALKFFPAHFSMERDRLEWGHVRNRPFLRLYHSYGLQLLKSGQTEDALEVFENILTLNPKDNQGVRGLGLECHFELKEPEGVLSVCRQYKGDGLPDLVYGRPLALFQLRRLKEASRALNLAIKRWPLVATELLKTRHRKPKGTNERYVSLGGADQAYWYWQRQGKHWAETPGAIEFLRQRWPGKRRSSN